MPISALSAIALVGVLFGIAFPLLKELLDAQALAVPSWWATLALQTLRFLGAAAVLGGLAVVQVRRWPTGPEVRQGVLIGLLVGVGMFLQVDALHHTTSGVVGYVTQGYVVWVPLATAVLLRRLPSLGEAAGALLVIVGVAVISGVRLDDLRLGRGATEVLGASLCFGAQIMIMGHPRWRANDGLQLSWISAAAVGCLGLPVVLLAGPGAAGLPAAYPDPVHLGSLVAVTLGTTALPFWLMNTFQRRLPDTVASLLYVSEALFAAGAGAVLPALIAPWFGRTAANETIGPGFAVAGFCILAGCVLAILGGRPRDDAPSG